MRIVESETADTLLTYRSRSGVPRIGESIFIHGLRDGEAHAPTYRIQQVSWEFEKPVALTSLQVVTVRVAPEKTQ